MILELRLKRAREWLADDSTSVAEVAYGVGFKSVAHFSRRFRDRYGRPPSKARGSGAPGPLVDSS